MPTVCPCGGSPLFGIITVASRHGAGTPLAAIARAISLTLTSLMAVAVLAAQSPTVRNAAILPVDCPYRQCELTFKEGYFGGRLLVGVDASYEIRSGLTGGGIVRAMSRVPRARRFARVAQVFQGTANLLRIAGVVGTVVAWREAGRSLDPPLARFFIVPGALIVVGIIPIVPQIEANSLFARAADAYNRELR